MDISWIQFTDLSDCTPMPYWLQRGRLGHLQRCGRETGHTTVRIINDVLMEERVQSFFMDVKGGARICSAFQFTMYTPDEIG